MIETSIRDTTKSLGVRCVWSQSGEDALRRASADPPSVIFLDLMSVRIRPLLVLRKLKGEDSPSREVPVVGFVTHTKTELKTRAHDLGCDFVYTRTVLTMQMNSIVRQLTQEAD
jgi:CheY-like chemotaxis protein